jgi:hypothetical protein
MVYAVSLDEEIIIVTGRRRNTREPNGCSAWHDGRCIPGSTRAICIPLNHVRADTTSAGLSMWPRHREVLPFYKSTFSREVNIFVAKQVLSVPCLL